MHLEDFRLKLKTYLYYLVELLLRFGCGADDDQAISSSY